MTLSAPIAALRARRPLVHCISNIVSANDCANLALAAGASPIMAQAPQEMAQISAAAAAVVLNTGTPDEEKFSACLAAGRAANAAGRPVVLDPVGVGASEWRLAHIRALLEEVRPAIVRVNYSEAAALLGQTAAEHGVDSTAPAGQELPAQSASRLAGRLGTVVLLSGNGDVITDGARMHTVMGGSDRMRQVTGAGCMLSVLCGAFAAVEPDAFEAACLAARFWKLCAAKAETQTAAQGAGSFHIALLDAASLLTDEELSAFC